MKSKIVYFILFVFLCEYDVRALNFPGPQVYVVTPATRSLRKDNGKPAPFYYHNWMRRMDTGSDITSTTTTTTESSTSNTKSPDLIFAEFESNGSLQKSIRKLLEKEKISPKRTTMSPIYIPDAEENKVTRVVNYGLPVKTSNYNETSSENVKYSYVPQEGYFNNIPTPVYYTDKPTTLSTTTSKTTTTASPLNVENIWHIIDNEKSNQYANWEEILVDPNNGKKTNNEEIEHEQKIGNEKNLNTEGGENNYEQEQHNDEEITIDEHFALPGFTTNPGNGAENESRAIRTEQNVRFPYINLKPFQIKSSNKPALYNSPNSKKSNLLTNLDNFYELKHPVRGEAQDTIFSSAPIDRYNPAQPYLPQQKYGSSLSKESSPVSTPLKATGTLSPPPPLPPKFTGDDFPAPTSYESFPPYAPSSPDFGSASAPQQAPSSVTIKPQQSVDVTSDFDASGPSDSGPIINTGYSYKPADMGDNDSGAPMLNTGYQYKPPVAPMPQFYPTPVPQVPSFQGYSYNKPSMTSDTLPMTAVEKPEFQGYHYNKPPTKPFVDHMPPNYGPSFSYGQDHYSPDSHEHDHSPPHIYEHDDTPAYGHDSEEPDMTYENKPYGDIKGSDDMKDDMGMKPPSPDTDVKAHGLSMDDHGFPSDFPHDFKFSPDFDNHDHDHDHDHEHYYYHDHTTTTTTTEMPRVNRFSYYYLGKKLYYLPLYFSVYFIIYVGALIIKAVLRHKIVYPNSWRPNTTTASFFSKRSVDEYLSNENLHELTKKVTHAIATAAEKYMSNKKEKLTSS